MPLEAKLASIDAGYIVDVGDENAARIRYLLSELSQATGLTKNQIGDKTVQASKFAKERFGVEIKNRVLMEDAHDLLRETPNMTYLEAMATVIKVRFG